MLRVLQGDGIPSFVVAALVIGVAPLAAGGDYLIGVGISVGAMAIAASGLILLVGYAHQLALGQAAFCIVGGYGSALLTVRAGWDPALALVASAALSMVVAYAIGRPILHLRGFVLAMASLAVQLVLIHAAVELLDFTGGSMGLTGVPRFSVLGFTFASDTSYYYLVWALAFVAVAICRNIDQSRVGRALRAISVTEAGAVSAGIDVELHKRQMFVISAGFASVAGSLTAHYLRIMEPHVFSVNYSLNMLIAVIIGGLWSPWGGVVGAIALSVLREALRGLSLPLVELLVVGVITVAVLMTMPRGLVGLATRFYRHPAPRDDAVPLETSATMFDERRRAEPGHSPAKSLLEVGNVSRSFGNLKAVDGVSFSVPEGSVTALIGPNGAGKTTMFNLLSGYETMDSGEVLLSGVPIEDWGADRIAREGVGRTFQLVQLYEGMTVLENVMCGRNRFARTSLASLLLRLPAFVAEERVSHAKAMAALQLVGIDQYAHSDPTILPFGLQRQVELARTLALEPMLLLMDEPASGLNDTETEQLGALILRIRASGTTVLLVEHDMRIVMGIADHVVVMDRGTKIAEGVPDDVRAMPQVITAYLGGHAA